MIRKSRIFFEFPKILERMIILKIFLDEFDVFFYCEGNKTHFFKIKSINLVKNQKN